MPHNIRTAIIGGGASGLIAGISAAMSGAKAIIFEKNERIGKKLLSTGNGRCNLTNRDNRIEHYHGNNPNFAMKALETFNLNKTLDFFNKLGLEFYTDEEGRIFPASLQANSVLDVLRFEADKRGVEIKPATEIVAAKKTNQQFQITAKNGESFPADKLIVTCGGKAAPETGSNGSGYQIAKQFGHKITPVFPALVQLKLEGTLFKAMDGVKTNGKIGLFVNENCVETVTDDILFTNYGVSGLAVLKLSRKAVEFQKQNPVLEFDFMPDLTFNDTMNIIEKRKEYFPERTMENFLTGWLNKRIGLAVLKAAGVTLSKSAGSLIENEKNKIASNIHAFRLTVAGDNGWNNAQVTAGGIDTNEINPDTMESKCVEGLYFAGEILDVDGDTGGYNLQWAWSSGFVAGRQP